MQCEPPEHAEAHLGFLVLPPSEGDVILNT